MLITWPITHPLAFALDRALGKELPTFYTKRELMEIISEHEDSEHSPVDQDEERIVHGALQFSNRPVAEVMTPRALAATLRATDSLDTSTRAHIAHQGYSRYPVVEGDPERVVGILYAKDVLVAPPDATVREVCERTHLRARPTDLLDTVLAHMLKRRQHMAIVSDEVGTFLGIITLEDIIEEVIQQEILDEDD